MIYTIAMLVINIALNIVLINLMGIIGAAIATLVVTLFVNILMLWQGAKLIRASVLKLINLKEIFFIIIQMVLAGCIAYGARLLCIHLSLASFATFIITYFVYAAIVFALNYKKVLCLFKEINQFKAS